MSEKLLSKEYFNQMFENDSKIQCYDQGDTACILLSKKLQKNLFKIDFNDDGMIVYTFLGGWTNNTWYKRNINNFQEFIQALEMSINLLQDEQLPEFIEDFEYILDIVK